MSVRGLGPEGVRNTHSPLLPGPVKDTFSRSGVDVDPWTTDSARTAVFSEGSDERLYRSKSFIYRSSPMVVPGPFMYLDYPHPFSRDQKRVNEESEV